MGSRIEYVDSSHIYVTRYVRNSKAIGVLWAIFTICYAIIGIMAFSAPEWLGRLNGDSPGKIGLWSTCYASEIGEKCEGKPHEFYRIGNVAFLAATICVGVACAAALLTICAMIFFFFCQASTVYHVCGWFQLISAACMIAGCASFPAGWDDESVLKVCLTSERYLPGDCGVLWAYMLAAISCFDAVILATLAFILATRHVRLQPDPHYAPASAYQSEIMNPAFANDSGSIAGSRKSLNLHPVLLMHPGQDDTYSQFSQRTVPRSTHSLQFGHPSHQYGHSSRHNFR